MNDSDLIQQWVDDGKSLADLPHRTYVVDRQIVLPRKASTDR
jgi:hypothetical protein